MQPPSPRAIRFVARVCVIINLLTIAIGIATAIIYFSRR